MVTGTQRDQLRKPRLSRLGFSLIEVTIALGIAAFCLVSMIGLIPVGLNNCGIAALQTEAINLLSAVAADLRNAPTAGVNAGFSPRYNIQVGDPTQSTVFYVNEDGGNSSVLGPKSQYRVSVTTVYQPNSGQTRATWENVNVSWPAAANSKFGQATLETSVSLARN